jgi:glycosyltransferase involved in cell wall biosynthesis
VVLVSGAAGMMGHGRRYLAHLGAGLAKSGADVHVVVPSGIPSSDDLAVAGATVHTIDVDFGRLNADRFRRFGALAGAARGLARMALGFAFFRRMLRDVLPVVEARASGRYVLHLLDYEYLSLAWLLGRLERRERAVPFVTVHPSDFGGFAWTLGSAYKSLLRGVLGRRLRRVAGVVCHGEWIGRRLVEQFRLDPERVHPFSYPSEGEDLRSPRDEARRRLGVAEDAPTTLWFGMIRRNKRLDLALDAFARLPGEHRLIVAGHPAEVEPEAIHARIAQLGIDDRVTLKLGYVPEPDIPLYFSAADVLLATHAPSFTSASGPVGDARTYRLPVVCSRSGQLRDYVQRFDTGIAVEEDTPEAFAAALAQAHRRAQDPSDGPAWREAIASAAQRLSWSAFAIAHASWYAASLDPAAGGDGA